MRHRGVSDRERVPERYTGLNTQWMAVWWTFRAPSLCRHVHHELLRSVLLDLPPVIAVTVFHQRDYVKRYSRSNGRLLGPAQSPVEKRAKADACLSEALLNRWEMARYVRIIHQDDLFNFVSVVRRVIFLIEAARRALHAVFGSVPLMRYVKYLSKSNLIF
jgi:hypothetical protein